MSKFKTVIPVDVAAIVGLLPKNSFVEAVTFDKDAGAVCVTWDNDRLKTPYSFAFDFPAENLKAQRIPEGVTVEGVTVAGKPVEPAAQVVDNGEGKAESGKRKAETDEGATVTPIAETGQPVDAGGQQPATNEQPAAKPAKRGKGGA